jgi:high-affinity iron transporter
MKRFISATAATLLVLVTALPLTRAAASSAVPADQGERIRALLLQAQLALTDRAQTLNTLTQARGIYDASFAAALDRAPDARARASAGFDAAEQAARAGRAPELAAARGRIWSALLFGSYRMAHQAVERGDGVTARAWLPLREYTRATRVSRPGADAAIAIESLDQKRIDARQAMQSLDADLLDAYQARLNTTLADARIADARGFGVRRAESAALAAGYFEILGGEFRRQRGDAAFEQMRARFTALENAAIAEQPVTALAANISEALTGFRAAPLSPAAQARRASQMLRFLKLVPVEYGRAIRNGVVAVDLEIQEAIVFHDSAQAAFTDLWPELSARDAAAARRAADQFESLAGHLRQASEHKTVLAPDAFRAESDALLAGLSALLPAEWLRQDAAADFDIVKSALDQMERAVAAGEYALAESARIDAYAIMESGPEAKITAFAPQYKAPIESHFWYGHSDAPGLAKLINARAPAADIRAVRKALDAELASAEQALTGSGSPTAVATNSGVIVFREGLEAVLILAALMASFKSGAKQHLRRPMWIGALLALAASVVTWLILRETISLFASFGEKLEAVVSLIAIGVLFLITNWFFHDVYWTGWMAKSHKQKQKIVQGAPAVEARSGFLGSQFLGLLVLGFTSVYREGFETALFLQALTLDGGAAMVALGALAGFALVALIGIAIFVLQAKLPVMRMLVVTGIMIGVVLLIMVGKTAHGMQVIGWLPLTPLRWLEFPYWFGLWFGTYATWEGLGLQLFSAVFVIGSYYLAEAAQKRRANAGAHAAARPTPHN